MISRTCLYPILLVCSYLINSACAAATLPLESPVAGGIAIINLLPRDQDKPIVHYKKKRVLVRRNENFWQAIVGIPLSAKIGNHTLKVKSSQHRTFRKDFSVYPKNYETQHITLKNKRMVEPTKEDLKRIYRERKIITGALSTWHDKPLSKIEFIRPVEGRLSSLFGLRRFFNGKARKPHSGLDFASAEGTPIIAPADGTIITTGHYFFNGKTVFIDHGQGLVSMYCHMNTITVKPDQLVKQGDLIGRVGMTGRVTGPHLHWSISLNDARVDPKLFLNSNLQ